MKTNSDGRVRNFESFKEIEEGIVVRAINWDKALPAWSDCIISKIDEETNEVTLARPYVYVGERGSNHLPLMGMETYKVTFTSLLTHYFMVLNSAKGGIDYPAKFIR